MPYCPRCRSEYEPSVSVCAECGVPLVESLPEEESRTGSDERLVAVWTGQGEMEAQVVRSILEASGIDCMISGESLRLTHGLTIDGLGQARVLVRESDLDRAREAMATSERIVECPACGAANPAGHARCRQCGEVLE